MSPELDARFQELANLEKGWRFGTGVPSDPHAQKRARTFASAAEALDHDVCIFPEAGGGILVSLEIYEFLFLPGKDSLIEVTYDLDNNYYKEIMDGDAISFLPSGLSSLDK